MRPLPWLLSTFAVLFAQDALAQAPKRQVPASVLAEVELLENRFEAALAADCAPERCFPKGCVYVDHTVADQPRTASLPGLGEEVGPGSVPPQEFLTRAHCAFAYERGVSGSDVQALVNRLQSKMSQGWTAVEVETEALPPVASWLQEPLDPPEEEAPEEAPAEAAPPEWTFEAARSELWAALLPHAWWMVGMGLFTMAASLLIWSWRRVGRLSPEEELLLRQMGVVPDAGAPRAAETTAAQAHDEDEDEVRAEREAWTARLRSVDPKEPDPELQALVADLLRTGERAVLAKAVLTFPEHFPSVFPTSGELASAKLDLAAFLKTVDPSELPDDLAFYRALRRHALAAAVASQPDARIARTLREEMGPAGLAALVGSLPARAGALLFALAPPLAQIEASRIMPARLLAAVCDQLLRSNRLDPAEAAHLLEVLQAIRKNAPLPAGPADRGVSDRGTVIDAPRALSVLLPQLDEATRASLFAAALARTQGQFASWVGEVFYPDLLELLPREERADILLEVDAAQLSGWVQLLEPHARASVLAAMPASLRASLSTPAADRSLDLALQGRQALAAAFQRQLRRAGVPFEAVAQPSARTPDTP